MHTIDVRIRASVYTSAVTGTGYWFGFRVSFDTQYVLFIVSRYRLILDIFYVTFQGYPFGVFMVIVYRAPVSLTSVFKTCHSPDLERADFDGQSFQ